MRITVLGAGYVGLPLSVMLSEHFEVICYDIDSCKISLLKNGIDSTGELSESDLGKLSQITFSENEEYLKNSDVFIVTVPTPIDNNKQPDLTALENASQTIARNLNSGGLVIYESTVYPGVTDEICIPILEKISGLCLNNDFHVGYSPERINPGDKVNTLQSINKIVSGSSDEAVTRVIGIYSTIINADLYQTKSIKVAEAAKIIENVQRDVNIALMNELSIALNQMNISIFETIEAASTKWNFLHFEPGLVGGHCIGVDPYYLIHKANQVGSHTRIISAAREISDRFGSHITDLILKEIIIRKLDLKSLRVLVLGFTFKENCNDTRNTRVIDVLNCLGEYGISSDIFDPYIDEYKHLPDQSYDVVLALVKHKEFLDLGDKWVNSLLTKKGFVFDLKNCFPSVKSRITL